MATGVPAAFTPETTVAVPIVSPVAEVTVNASPSGSESLLRTVELTETPSSVKEVSCCAIGLSFPTTVFGITLMVNVVESVDPKLLVKV